MFLAGAPFVGAQDAKDAHAHHHGHEAQATATAELKQRHAVDAPLKSGMGKIRSAVESLAHHEMGHLDEAQVSKLATTIEEQVQYLIANCKLEPAADAALHGIIGRLLEGAKALQDHPQDAAPVAKLRAALADYPKLFDDADWHAPAE
jgi:hypothetical protein